MYPFLDDLGLLLWALGTAHGVTKCHLHVSNDSQGPGPGQDSSRRQANERWAVASPQLSFSSVKLGSPSATSRGWGGGRGDGDVVDI